MPRSLRTDGVRTARHRYPAIDLVEAGCDHTVSSRPNIIASFDEGGAGDKVALGFYYQRFGRTLKHRMETCGAVVADQQRPSVP